VGAPGPLAGDLASHRQETAKVHIGLPRIRAVPSASASLGSSDHLIVSTTKQGEKAACMCARGARCSLARGLWLLAPWPMASWTEHGDGREAEGRSAIQRSRKHALPLRAAAILELSPSRRVHESTSRPKLPHSPDQLQVSNFVVSSRGTAAELGWQLAVGQATPPGSAASPPLNNLIRGLWRGRKCHNARTPDPGPHMVGVSWGRRLHAAAAPRAAPAPITRRAGPV